MNPYEILGVASDATPEEIKAAHRALAKRYHPDVCKDEGAGERLQEINAAYDELKKKPSGRRSSSNFTSMDDFVAFARAQAAKMQADVRAIVELSLEDAFTGRRIKIGNHDVDIPAGVDNNSTLVIPKAGRVVENIHGDLIIGIQIKPHTVFERHFNDLYTEVKIDVFDAMMGCELDIKGLDGKTVTLTIPAGCNDGQQVAANGQGMSIMHSDSRGYLIGVLRVKIPALTQDQVSAMKDLLK